MHALFNFLALEDASRVSGASWNEEDEASSSQEK